MRPRLCAFKGTNVLRNQHVTKPISRFRFAGDLVSPASFDSALQILNEAETRGAVLEMALDVVAS